MSGADRRAVGARLVAAGAAVARVRSDALAE
jgi:hypothetical protein